MQTLDRCHLGQSATAGGLLAIVIVAWNGDLVGLKKRRGKFQFPEQSLYAGESY